MLMFKSPLFYLLMVPKYKHSFAGNSEMPKRSHRVLLLNEKVKEKNCILRFLRSTVKKKPICEIVKEKEIHASFLLLHLKLQKLQPQCVLCALQRSRVLA